jgi:hypothetical protein
MREFTKSLFSFSWVMSLFGVQQSLNLVNPSQATRAFKTITDTAVEQLNAPMKATFKAGDNLQRGAVDMTMGLFSWQVLNPSWWMRMTSDMMQKSVEAAGQGMKGMTSGWGSASNAGEASSPEQK